jgi:hypothetical protein
MSHFRGRGRNRVMVTLPMHAAGLLASLAAQLVELLSDGEAIGDSDDPLEDLVDLGPPREAPEDPALRRLLPDGLRDDPEAAAEFRRFTERSLRRGKIDDAKVVLAAVRVPDVVEDELEFELNREQVRSWLRCLTDMRLTLAERLGVQADDDDYWESLPEDDPRMAVHDIYQWLGYLLESLLDVVRH